MRYKVMSFVLFIVFMIGIIPINAGTAYAKEYTIKDVDQSDEAYQEIQDVLNQGWMSLTLGKFFPDKNITRAEFAMILTKWNNQISEVSKVKTVSFKDVSIKDKYGKYIELQKDYVTYYKKSGGKYFKPKNYLTREDAVVAFVKALGYNSEDAIESGSVTEVDIDEWIADYNKISSALLPYVSIGITNELIDLYEDGGSYYFYPKKYITRRQMAQLLMNAEKAKEFNKFGGDESDEDADIDNSDEEAVIDSEYDTDTDIDNKTNSSQSNNNTNSGNNNSNSGNNTSDNSYQNNEMGYLKIDLNGKEMIYKQRESVKLGEFWSFYYDKYSANNNFSFELPTDIESGDSITVNSKDNLIFYPMYVQYTNASGEIYGFGYPIGHTDGGEHISSKITITITERGSKGGYITGTIEGELVLSDEVVTFSDGEFKYKIPGSNF